MSTVVHITSHTGHTAWFISSSKVSLTNGQAIEVVGLTSLAVSNFRRTVTDLDTETVLFAVHGVLSRPTVFRVVDGATSRGQHFVSLTGTSMGRFVIGREWWAFAVSGLTDPVFSGELRTVTSESHWVSNGSVRTLGNADLLVVHGWVTAHTNPHSSSSSGVIN